MRGNNKELYTSLLMQRVQTSGLLLLAPTNFTLGTDAHVNQSSKTYVAWAWDAGTSTASNTDGSITSSVRVNQSAGFYRLLVITVTIMPTVGHGLNAAPEFIITENRDDAFKLVLFIIRLLRPNTFGLDSE